MKPDKISYPLEKGLELIGANRSAGYRAIATGELKSFKLGKRRMVTHQALEDFIALKEAESQQGARSRKTDSAPLHRAVRPNRRAA